MAGRSRQREANNQLPDLTSWRSLLTLQRTGSRPRVKAWPGGGQAEGTWVASSGQVLLEEARDSVPSNHLYQQLGEDLEAEIRSHTGSACPLYSQALTTSEAVHLTPPRFSSSPQSGPTYTLTQTLTVLPGGCDLPGCRQTPAYPFPCNTC